MFESVEPFSEVAKNQPGVLCAAHFARCVDAGRSRIVSAGLRLCHVIFHSVDCMGHSVAAVISVSILSHPIMLSEQQQGFSQRCEAEIKQEYRHE